MTMSNASQDVVTKVLSIQLDHQPSALEFVPFSHQHFIVGSYKLEDTKVAESQRMTKQTESDEDEPPDSGAEKAAQSRSGALTLFHLDVDDAKLTKVLTKEMSSAVTDLRFCPHNTDIFAVTCTDGTITVYRVKQDCSDVAQVSDNQQFDSLVLSCAWDPNCQGLMTATLDTGHVSVVKWSEGASSWTSTILADSIIHHESRFSAHEAWVAVFSPKCEGHPESPGQRAIVYSGGDDAMLRAVQLPRYEAFCGATNSDHDFEEPLKMKGHEAGVTSILPIPTGDLPSRRILITGSYDDHIRVVSMYSPRTPESDRLVHKPTVLAELNLGGGVWKLKFMRDYAHMARPSSNEDTSYFVLVSCMHAGARIVEVKENVIGEWKINVLGRFVEHKSMCYAADVQPRSDGGSKTDVCVSSSFYDRLLAVWQYHGS